MSNLRLIDCHTHTSNSPDGKHSTYAVCQQALLNRLGGLAITDHCECDLFRKDRYDLVIQQSYFEAEDCAQRFRDSGLMVLKGVEMGQPLQGPEAAQDVLKLEWDVVLASVHNNPGMPDFYFLDKNILDDSRVHKLLEDYFHHVYDTVCWEQFDVLAHLTYPLRYVVGRYRIPVRLADYRDIIDAILRTLARSGKALEINTSGLRQPYGMCLPHEPIVRRFKELGGEYISLGSDAHTTQDVGKNLADGAALAKLCGFDKVTYYVARKPHFIEI